MVPPARSTRGGAEDSIIIDDFQLPIADLAFLWSHENTELRKVTIWIARLQIGNRQLAIGNDFNRHRSRASSGHRGVDA